MHNHGQGHLSNSALKALRCSYAGFAIRTLVSLAIGVLLARLLGPKPYGQIAAAALVIGLASLISDAGFSSALVQEPDLTKEAIRFAFGFQVAVAITLGLISAAVAPLVAKAFHDEAVCSVLWGLSPIFLFQSFGQTSAALLKRRMEFRIIQKAQIISYLLGYGVVGVAAALSGTGVWSIVTAQLTQAVLNSVILYSHEKHSVVPYFSSGVARLLHFGTKVTANNVVCWGIANLDNVTVGHAFGATSLGYYNRAFTLAAVPTSGIVGTWQQVLFAACSRASDKRETIRRVYLASVAAMALIVCPVFLSSSLCSDLIIRGLLGVKWLPAIPLFRILSIAIIFDAVASSSGPILTAIGHPHKELRAQCIALMLAVVTFGVASRFSLIVLACSVAFVYFLRLCFTIAPLFGVLDLHLYDIASALQGGACLGTLTAAASYTTKLLAIKLHMSAIAAMIALILIGLIVTLGALLCLGHRLVASEIVGILRSATGQLPEIVDRFIARLEREQSPYTCPSNCREQLEENR